MFPHDCLGTGPQMVLCTKYGSCCACAITSLVLEMTMTVSSAVVSFSWRDVFKVSSSLHLFWNTEDCSTPRCHPVWPHLVCNMPNSSSIFFSASAWVQTLSAYSAFFLMASFSSCCIVFNSSSLALSTVFLQEKECHFFFSLKNSDLKISHLLDFRSIFSILVVWKCNN